MGYTTTTHERAADTVYMDSVSDRAGLPVNCHAGVRCVVSQSPYLTHAIRWLGYGTTLVGTSRYDSFKTVDTGGVLDPDAEVIARLQPDLVVASNWASVDMMSAATPAGARLLQLDGFQSIDDSARMLQTLYAALSGMTVEESAQASRLFLSALRMEISRVNGQARRALLISACTDFPYSLGAQRFIGEVFRLCGFCLVETEPRVRHLRQGEALQSLDEAIRHFEPQVVFALNEQGAVSCTVALYHLSDIRLVRLEREHFFHPGPAALKGVQALAQLFPAC